MRLDRGEEWCWPVFGRVHELRCRLYVLRERARMRVRSNELNSNVLLTGDSSLTSGTSICLKQYTPLCTLNDTATTTECTPLTTKWNITTSNFVEYNEDVDDCNNITSGKPVRFWIMKCVPDAVGLTFPRPFSSVLCLDRWVLSGKRKPIL